MTTLGLDIDGTIVGTSTLSEVDGPAGRLSYRGYDLHDLVTQATWEEVVHLLWYGELPTESQLATLHQRFAAERILAAEEVALLHALPAELHGMDAIRSIVSLLSALYRPAVMTHEHLLDEGVRLTAKLPSLLATWIRLRYNQDPVPPDPTLGQAANFLRMLTGTNPDDVATHALDTYMVILAENGLNVSTFVACVVASTHNDILAAITAALATLKGVAHGGANEQAMRTFQAIGSPANVEDYIEGMLTRKERLMGVGHRVFEVEDPRMRHMRQQSQALAERFGSDATMHGVAMRVAEVISTHPYYQFRNLYPNVEFYSAPLLCQLGFPVDCFTAVFACARMPGWIAHIHEQLTNRRLVRPEAEYVGVPQREFVPLARR